jgi:hypothetical protein
MDRFFHNVFGMVFLPSPLPTDRVLVVTPAEYALVGACKRRGGFHALIERESRKRKERNISRDRFWLVFVLVFSSTKKSKLSFHKFLYNDHIAWENKRHTLIEIGERVLTW